MFACLHRYASTSTWMQCFSHFKFHFFLYTIRIISLSYTVERAALCFTIHALPSCCHHPLFVWSLTASVYFCVLPAAFVSNKRLAFCVQYTPVYYFLRGCNPSVVLIFLVARSRSEVYYLGCQFRMTALRSETTMYLALLAEGWLHYDLIVLKPFGKKTSFAHR